MSIEPTSTIGEYEAKVHFTELLEKVKAGEEVTITRLGVPVAKLVPIAQDRSAAERRAAIERIKMLSKNVLLNGLTLRNLIDEGRR